MISAHISKAGIEAKVDGRVKHFFSIYRKMVNQHKTLDQIYDLFAVPYYRGYGQGLLCGTWCDPRNVQTDPGQI